MRARTRALAGCATVAAVTALLPTAGCAGGVPAGEERAPGPGFVRIFNGRDLTGWDGDPKHWSVVKEESEDGDGEGVIRGDSTENRARGNNFIIWRAGRLKDFELKLRYRIHGGNNSGVQYRSKEVEKWVVSGYQAEVQNLLGKTGFLYHEKGRGWLVEVGDFMEIARDGSKAVVGEVANLSAVKKAPYHVDREWNEYHFVARGNHVVHYLGGYQTVELIDRHVDENRPFRARCMEGVLALQVHGGGPMTVDFKDIRVKHLRQGFGEARRLFNGENLEGWAASSEVARKAWSVSPAENPNTRKRNSRAEVKIGGVLSCDGSREGTLRPAGELGRSYIVRFQKRLPGRKATGGDTPFKPVLGWSVHEVTVDGPKADLRVDGVVRTDLSVPVEAGKLALPAERAEYRNVVLIPVTGGG